MGVLMEISCSWHYMEFSDNSAIQAQNQFEFIDYWFIPIGQRHELAGTDVSTKFYLAIKFKKIML